MAEPMIWEVSVGEDNVALLSTREDYDLVRRYTWYLSSEGYAQSRVAGTITSMHRLVMRNELVPGLCIDHINQNKLDNRRTNLRVCTIAQNRLNVKGRVGTSQYKGVSWYPKLRKWHARITINGRHSNIGYFLSEEDAARAYDHRARELHGQYAYLNFGEMHE